MKSNHTATCIFFMIFILLLTQLYCQAQNQAFQNSPNTYALIIGISTYKYLKDDIEYSHKEAFQFRELLMSEEGGNIPEEHIIMLRDISANQKAIFDSFEFILGKVKEGDRVIIFFSGYIDAFYLDKFRIFLLPYDVQMEDYASFAINLDRFRELINSLNKKSDQVLLVMDISKPGQLLGGIEEKKLIYEELVKNWGSETKLLSSRNEEYSFEDPELQLGVFTHFLIESIAGQSSLLDFNRNDIIQLGEIENYLTVKVNDYTKGKQNPVIVGKLEVPIGYVQDPDLKASGSILNTLPQPSGSTNIIDEPFSDSLNLLRDKKRIDSLLNSLPPRIILKFGEFNNAIKRNQFTHPYEGSAEEILDQLEKVEGVELLLDYMKKMLIESISLYTQDRFREYFDKGSLTLDSLESEHISKMFAYVDEELPTNHPLKKQYLSRKLFFESLTFHSQSQEKYVALKEANSLIGPSVFIAQEFGNYFFARGNLDSAYFYYDFSSNGGIWPIPDQLKVAIKDSLASYKKGFG